jgi:type I restriction enzyme S subunit
LTNLRFENRGYSRHYQFVRNLRIPIAPLAEQHRIVAHIDGLFAEIVEGEAALERARSGLDTWRRALLKAAVTGELTRDWREANRPNESGADLLAGIQAARKKDSSKRGADFARKRESSPKRELQPNQSDEVRLPEVPDAWAIARLDDLFAWSSGEFLPAKTMLPGKVPVFGGNGITGHHNEALVHQPTIVVGRVGFYCGSVHLTSEPAWITDNAIFAKSMPPRCDPTYLQIALLYANLGKLAQGGAQPFVNQKLLNSVSIAFPPSSEQEEIAKRWQSLVGVEIEITGEIQKQTASVAQLRQSILKSAFEGNLVPQDPNDEPASALLAGLRAEAPSAPRRTRGRKVAS